MIGAGLWRSRTQTKETVHQWRARRSCWGELVQWDTSEHDWLEGRGEKLYLIHMIDDATQRVDGALRGARLDGGEHAAAVVLSGTPWEAGRVLYKASLFRTAPKIARDVKEVPRAGMVRNRAPELRRRSRTIPLSMPSSWTWTIRRNRQESIGPETCHVSQARLL